MCIRDSYNAGTGHRLWIARRAQSLLPGWLKQTQCCVSVDLPMHVLVVLSTKPDNLARLDHKGTELWDTSMIAKPAPSLRHQARSRSILQKTKPYSVPARSSYPPQRLLILNSPLATRYSLANAASNATAEGVKSCPRIMSRASGAPNSRSIPLSSHSMESGP